MILDQILDLHASNSFSKHFVGFFLKAIVEVTIIGIVSLPFPLIFVYVLGLSDLTSFGAIRTFTAVWFITTALVFNVSWCFTSEFAGNE